MVDVPNPQSAWLDDFRRLEPEAGVRDPEWLRALRETAAKQFANLGFPGPKHEEWKYTNVGPIARTRFVPAQAVSDPARGSFEASTFGAMDGHRLVFVNGRSVPRLSYVPSADDGLRVMPLSETLADGAKIEPFLGRIAGFEKNPFIALNTAFARDGAFLDVPRGRQLEIPIYLLFLGLPSSPPWVAHPRNLILLGDGSHATIIEMYLGVGSGTYLTNAVTEVVAGENATLDHVKVQLEPEAAYHVATMSVEQKRNANVSCTTISLGGGLARSDVRTIFTGEGGEVSMSGLFVIGGRQHFDAHTWIDHRTPSCTSRELYKGILDGSSRGVFNGMIYVRRGAQKTVARQTNKNLLLSKDAHVDSTPGLEIQADDVKCNHGSSIGQLDENSIFYLRSRGIDQETARSLLTYAFGNEIVNLVKVPALRDRLDEFILSRLPNSDAVREALMVSDPRPREGR